MHLYVSHIECYNASIEEYLALSRWSQGQQQELWRATCSGRHTASGTPDTCNLPISLSEEPPLVRCIGQPAPPAVLGVGLGQLLGPSLMLLSTQLTLISESMAWLALPIRQCQCNWPLFKRRVCLQADCMGVLLVAAVPGHHLCYSGGLHHVLFQQCEALQAATCSCPHTCRTVPRIWLSRLLHAPVLTHAVHCHVSCFPGCYMLSGSGMQCSATC